MPDMRKILSLAFMSAVAAGLFACGGGSGNTASGPNTLSNADMEVDTYRELPSCVEKREGKTAYVVDQDQGYVCTDGEWVEDDNAVKVYPSNSSTAKGGSFTDSRDGQTYRTVKIGSQTWMAENLNYEMKDSYCYRDSAKYCKKYGRIYTWPAAVGKSEKECGYGHVCGLSGRVRGVCPSGWHLPSNEEWETLIDFVGGESVMGQMLKSTSGWERNRNGLDKYGFNALPAGSRSEESDHSFDNDHYHGLGIFAQFWSSTEYKSESAYSMNLIGDDNNEDAGFYPQHKNSDYGSVRCIQDGSFEGSGASLVKSSSSASKDSRDGGYDYAFTSTDEFALCPCNELREGRDAFVGRDKDLFTCVFDRADSLYLWVGYEDTLTAVGLEYHRAESSSSSVSQVDSDVQFWDMPKETYLNPKIAYEIMTDTRDGKKYKTVSIGERTWMSENLNYYKETDLSVKDKSWCYGNNPENCDVAGRLYTWAAAIDSAKLYKDKSIDCGYGKTCALPDTVYGICPPGWHLPNYTEWSALFAVAGGESYGTFKALQSQTGWIDEGDGSDAFGFSALPAGYRNGKGNFVGSGYGAYFWSANEDLGYVFHRGFGNTMVDSELFAYSKIIAFSVRCVENQK